MMYRIAAFDAFITYLLLCKEIDLETVNFLVFLFLRQLQNYTPNYFFMKILKVLMMKMSVNFMLNEHVISNQRTLVFLLCMQKRK